MAEKSAKYSEILLRTPKIMTSIKNLIYKV